MAEKPVASQDQQREFVRVDDVIPLAWRRIEASDLTGVLAFFEKNRTFPAKRGDDIQQLMTALDVSGQLKRLENSDPVLARVLNRMDQKLNLLLRLFHPGEGERPLIPTRVNLSGCGVAFSESSPALAEGDMLEVRMALGQDVLATIECYCRVMKVFDPDEEGLSQVACKFEPILDPDRERVIRHIFKRQSEQLRAQRGS